MDIVDVAEPSVLNVAAIDFASESVCALIIASANWYACSDACRALMFEDCGIWTAPHSLLPAVPKLATPLMTCSLITVDASQCVNTAHAQIDFVQLNDKFAS